MQINTVEAEESILRLASPRYNDRVLQAVLPAPYEPPLEPYREFPVAVQEWILLDTLKYRKGYQYAEPRPEVASLLEMPEWPRPRGGGLLAGWSGGQDVRWAAQDAANAAGDRQRREWESKRDAFWAGKPVRRPDGSWSDFDDRHWRIVEPRLVEGRQHLYIPAYVFAPRTLADLDVGFNPADAKQKPSDFFVVEEGWDYDMASRLRRARYSRGQPVIEVDVEGVPS